MARTGRPREPRNPCEICGTPVRWNRNRFCSRSCANRDRAIPLADRFWEFVEKRDGCWGWSGATDSDGYGVITGEPPRRNQLRAPRVSYELHFGPIPPGEHVLHDCDNPPCVNPEHLYAGAEADNTRDKVSRKRHSFGENHGRAKLSYAAAARIRKEYAEGVSLDNLAATNGVSPAAIWFVVKGKHWKPDQP